MSPHDTDQGANRPEYHSDQLGLCSIGSGPDGRPDQEQHPTGSTEKQQRQPPLNPPQQDWADSRNQR